MSQPGPSSQHAHAGQDNEDIMRTLLAHEKKSMAPLLGAPVGGVREDTSSSESEDDFQVSKPGASSTTVMAEGERQISYSV